MNTSQFPKKLNICGVPYKIRYLDEPKVEDGKITYGEYYRGRQVIEIAIGAHEDEHHVWNTLLHEAIHAILHMSGQTQDMGEDKEEAIVTALEYGLAGLWPQLQKWA